ncbi:MAG TPA: tRNA (guanosine(46)-N7)-methyltransferase TrmB, partial [Bacteroidia bacterium]|nr:tRNA (guanosine(46)-N7)-methyltransferase TrmB [Bacteroidia bacterium]
MGKNKLRRFAENETFPNLFQPRMVFPPVDHPMKGHWGEQVFGNPNPLTLELGCGRGEYTVGLSA